MSATREWIVRKLGRPGMPSLDLALLTERGQRFALSRLSFVYLRALVRTAVHVAELSFMTRDFPLEFAVPLFSMRALFGLWGSLWWGPLEAVRRRVRDEVNERRPGRALASIEAWACIAACIGLSTCAGSAWTVAHERSMEWSYDGLYGSYLLVSAMALAVDLWSRTLHAGVFALGRVYRSKWSMIVPDLLEVGLIVGLWRYLGPFALGASVLVTSLLRSGLTLFYTRQAYRSRRLSWPRFMRLRALARVELQDLRVAARGLLGIIPSQLDRALLMSLLVARTAGYHVLPIAAPYYALRPVAGVAQGWARTYYVDLVRMDSLSTTLFRHRLERLLRSVSVMAGALAGGTLIAGGALLFGVPGAQAAAWLVPLSFLRSHFSVLQIRALAYARTDVLAALSLAMVAVVGCTFYVRATDRQLVALVTALLVVAAIIVGHAQSRARNVQLVRARKVTLGAWLSELCEQRTAVRLHLACVSTKLARPAAVLHQLQSVSSTRRTTRIGRAWLLWWEDGASALGKTELAVLLGGTCEQHVSCDAGSGWEALDQACRAGHLPVELAAALAAPRSDSVCELRASFARALPMGHVVDAQHASAGLAQLSTGELSLVRRALIAEAREQLIVPRQAQWQVAVYAPHGEPALAFVWPAHALGAGEFRRAVVHAGWRDSLPRSLHGQAAALPA
ncbi:MAG TPA: hypothetical protein VF331_12950 [Polyangiales bacterium]